MAKVMKNGELVDVADDNLYIPPVVPSTDPNEYPLNRFQFEAFALDMGLTMAGLESMIGQLPGLTDREKAIAKSRLKNAITYNRNHPLFDALKPLAGVTDKQIDDAWMLAKDLK